MTVTIGTAIESLREAITGRVIDPADPEYDDARRVWNAGIDAQPAVIASCFSTSDVQKAIAFALDAVPMAREIERSGARVAEVREQE